jgi:hypothetical protein
MILDRLPALGTYRARWQFGGARAAVFEVVGLRLLLVLGYHEMLDSSDVDLGLLSTREVQIWVGRSVVPYGDRFRVVRRALVRALPLG